MTAPKPHAHSAQAGCCLSCGGLRANGGRTCWSTPRYVVPCSGVYTDGDGCRKCAASCKAWFPVPRKPSKTRGTASRQVRRSAAAKRGASRSIFYRAFVYNDHVELMQDWSSSLRWRGEDIPIVWPNDDEWDDIKAIATHGSSIGHYAIVSLEV